ncbi:hypothetical protein C9927_00020 [Pseudidiomarina aestuarii]|uniref:Cellulose biosynthesis protein BcsE n=1 Tax=Pseudidiomarina aestuarii TaxID=624146 RepID=A0A2T4CVD7_9GAMM|nr:hypothetical protein C9988_00910 [Pseudidiomarina aestuarii]PTB86187.1 hypothetical protein C9940_03445 [Pseudidiomarina aestuarii]PTB90389.1 hypothetical protein C9928_00355 [Pseudidiomarina aestuarii]PTB90468.1 hypothetical protein C9927_00020 [Pseudidiomarina aestuarii]
MKLDLDSYFIGLENQLPAIRAGELHLFVVQDHEWIERIANFFAQQTRILYLVEAIASINERIHFATSYDTRTAELKRLKKYRAGTLVSALTNVAAPHDAIIFHIRANSSESFITFLFDDDGMSLLRDWARKNEKILIVLFEADPADRHIRSRIGRQATNCQSLNTLYQGQPDWRWDIHHWFDGMKIIQKELRLRIISPILTEVVHDIDQSNDAARLLSAEAPVYYVHNALDGSEVAPIEWLALEREDDWLQALKSWSDDAIVIGFFRGQTMQTLLRTVYEIRKTTGPFVRIYVRERDQAIRHHDERLLMQAGATIVLPYGLRFSQVVSLIENSIDWRFNKRLPEHFNDLIDLLVPEQLQGYLPTSEFAESSLQLAELAEKQGIDYTLIKAEPASGHTPLSILRSFKHRREGDLSTTDGNNVYFFLFACRASDADRALTFLFGLPIQNIFKSEERIHSLYLVTTCCNRLVEAGGPDFSEDLKQSNITVERHEDAYDRYFPRPKPVKSVRLR